MSRVFPRHVLAAPVIADHGDGVYIFDKTGKKYIDASGGAAVSCLGHSDAQVTKAVKNQLDHIAFAHTGFFTSEPAEDLAEKLVELAPGDLDRVYLVCGGSEAIEAALKLARQYFVERGETSRTRFIARRQSYHGNTLGALATGGNVWRRAPFAPLMIETSHIAPCYEYRDCQPDETPAEYGLRVANELEAELKRVGPENVIAFVAEPVVGATAGAVPPVEGYFKRIRQICDQYGILLILDEIMCGMGRTGTLFAYQQDGIVPDIVTIAKGLGAGYQPAGAMMCTEAIYQTIADGSGFFQHGHTYIGHPTVSAAALAVLGRLVDDNLVAQVNPKGDRLMQALNDRFGQHPYVGDIRGRGLFQALELVENRETKAPFDPSRGLAKVIKAAAFETGLICYPMSGTIDGKLGDHILLAPPFIVTDDHIGEIVDKLAIAMAQAL